MNEETTIPNFKTFSTKNIKGMIKKYGKKRKDMFLIISTKDFSKIMEMQNNAKSKNKS